MTGPPSLPIPSESIVKQTSPVAESPNSKRQLPCKEEILSFTPQKQVLEVDASVAAYFADLFRDLRNQQ
jgi:hypothetical protein